MGILEVAGIFLAVVGLVFAFEAPRERFLRFIGYKDKLQAAPAEVSTRLHSDRLGEFLVEAQVLRRRSREEPIPVAAHNAWVEVASQYLRDQLGSSYAARFNDFSGMTFYGDGSEHSNYEKSLDGRSRRLNEFLAELSK